MKKTIIMAAMVFILAISGIEGLSEYIQFNTVIKAYAAEVKGTGAVTGNDVNVRSGPNKSSEKLGTIGEGKIVTIVGEEKGWYEIEFDGGTGYIYSDYVTLSENTLNGNDENTAVENKDVEAEATEDTGKTNLLSDFFSGSAKTILIIIAIAIVLIIIIFATIASIKRMDDDDYDESDDCYDEYDDDYDDDDDYYDEYGDDHDDYSDEDGDGYADDYHHKSGKYYREKRKTSPPKAGEGADPARYMSNNPDDYRINIDPKFFETTTLPVIEDEDAPTPIEKKVKDNAKHQKKHGLQQQAQSKKEAELAEAMRKMEELQKELERIKNSD